MFSVSAIIASFLGGNVISDLEMTSATVCYYDRHFIRFFEKSVSCRGFIITSLSPKFVATLGTRLFAIKEGRGFTYLELIRVFSADLCCFLS